MDTTTTAHIQFDQINLSSLKSVVNIYQNKRNDDEHFETKLPLITNHFGLPLSIASFENRVIGYAFVIFTKTGKTEINSYWEKEFYSVEAEQDLKFHAEKTFDSMFKDPETRRIKIQNATERLLNWLNSCN
ncbi:hypothetical protein [Flavobacterium sp. FlaQc-48]|uniref:hypothetical protein n=1 Tax=Flavobacterium sp. FlaQc-48 TaxID=3374181 RepID=UPI0037572066